MRSMNSLNKRFGGWRIEDCRIKLTAIQKINWSIKTLVEISSSIFDEL